MVWKSVAEPIGGERGRIHDREPRPGLVLLVAARLKAYALTMGATASTGFFTSHWFQLALIEWEAVLGLALLAGFAPGRMRPIALTCFAAFGVFALFQGIMGAKTCGCAGLLAVSPWMALIFDLAAVVALAIFSPATPDAEDKPRPSLIAGNGLGQGCTIKTDGTCGDNTPNDPPCKSGTNCFCNCKLTQDQTACQCQ